MPDAAAGGMDDWRDYEYCVVRSGVHAGKTMRIRQWSGNNGSACMDQPAELKGFTKQHHSPAGAKTGYIRAQQFAQLPVYGRRVLMLNSFGGKEKGEKLELTPCAGSTPFVYEELGSPLSPLDAGFPRVTHDCYPHKLPEVLAKHECLKSPIMGWNLVGRALHAKQWESQFTSQFRSGRGTVGDAAYTDLPPNQVAIQAAARLRAAV